MRAADIEAKEEKTVRGSDEIIVSQANLLAEIERVFISPGVLEGIVAGLTEEQLVEFAKCFLTDKTKKKFAEKPIEIRRLLCVSGVRTKVRKHLSELSKCRGDYRVIHNEVVQASAITFLKSLYMGSSSLRCKVSRLL